MLTMDSRGLDSDRVFAAGVAMPPVLPDETPLEPVGRSPVGQSRTLTEVRMCRLLETRIEFVPHPSFDDPATFSMILNAASDISRGRDVARVKPPAGTSPILEGIYDEPLLTREQEVHLFRKLNFLKHQASRFRGAITPAKVAVADLHRVEALLSEALEVRNQIIRANLRLVVSLVKKFRRDDDDLAELVSNGYVALMRAVERFDFSRGYKFSTYASWVIINSRIRDSARDHQRDRLRIRSEALLAAAPDHRNNDCPCETEQERCRELLRRMLVRLNDRERKIIVSRFGLEGTRQKTLNQLGKQFGISKERVRQLEKRAREKLREIAEAQKLDPMAF
jgi:RNA polymerase primary sigma factor